MEQNKTQYQLWEWVKAISALVLVGVVAIKIYTTPTSLINIDFPNLLSLLLALFSVTLSTLFYFKATEASNTFYDNTYKYTKDIALLLVRIESGFGERLKNLDDGYTSMRNQLEISTVKQTNNVEKTQKKIETEENELKKVITERDNIINELAEKTMLQEEEKQHILTELKKKDDELTKIGNETNKLKKRLIVEKLNNRNIRDKTPDLNSGIAIFTFDIVIQKIGVEKVIESSLFFLRKRFSKIIDELPRQYIEDLKAYNLFDNELTTSGARFLKDVAIAHKK